MAPTINVLGKIGWMLGPKNKKEEILNGIDFAWDPINGSFFKSKASNTK